MSKNLEGIRKIFAVPHFHYDVEWWKTEDGYDVDVEIILDKAFEMLEKHAAFTFTIDQALALKPYWEKHPEMHERIRGYVQEGRLEMIGGTWCSPDVNIPTGEALVRQYVYGLKFFEGEVGCGVTTAWEIDTFGHSAQFPQIAAGAGMKGLAFSRGVQEWRDESSPIHFYWESPDGTRILINWFAAHYVAFAPIGTLPMGGMKAFSKEMNGRINYEGKRTVGEILMFPFGSDFTVPTEEWLELVDRWNKNGEEPEVEFSLPGKFFEALECEFGEKLPVVRGEFNPILTGCYESREKVKKLCRESQYGIMSTEKWCALATVLTDADYPRNELNRAWELILENDFHDIVCGTGTDKVYQNTLKRYKEAIELTEAAGESARACLVQKYAETKGAGTKVAVFNSLNWNQHEIVSIPLKEVGGEGGDTENIFKVKGPDGKVVLCQVEQGKLMFIADVPSVGFSVYRVEKSKDKGKAESELKIHELTVENEFLKIELDPISGGIVSLYDKELDCEMIDSTRWQGNEIVMEEDAGNLWTVQKTGREWSSRESRNVISIIETGPLRAGFEVRGNMKEMDLVRKIYLAAGSRRVDFETEIDFKGKDRRVKVMFAAPFSGKPVFETPFYTQPREPGHHCAQNWVDISDGQRGLAVMNSGNPGTDVENNSIGLVLFRSVSVFSGAFLRFLGKNWKEILKMGRNAFETASQGLGMSLAEWEFYEAHGLFLREWSSAGVDNMKPGLNLHQHLIPWLQWNRKSDAWERGKHEFRYAVYSHAGDWQTANLPRRGWEFNTLLEPVVLKSSGTGKCKSATFFETGHDESLNLTALKLSESEGEKTLVARVYDALGSGGSLKLRMGDDDNLKCRKTNLVESESGRLLKKTKSGTMAKLRPWEIASYFIEK